LHLAHRQHRSDAGVAAGKDALPLLARARRNGGGKALAQDRPALAVVLLGKPGGSQTQFVHELRIEALLDGADRQPLAVFVLTHIVPGRTRIDEVDPSLVLPWAL